MAKGFGKLRRFGIDMTQEDDVTIFTDVDDKLGSLYECPPTRIRRQQSDNFWNDIERALSPNKQLFEMDWECRFANLLFLRFLLAENKSQN